MKNKKLFNKEHTSIQLALKIIAKFGFINKQIFLKDIAQSSRSQSFKDWNRLIKTGYLNQYNQPGVSQNYFHLSKKGKTCLAGLGLKTVIKQHPIYFEHDEVLMTFVVQNELKRNILSDWSTEKELKAELPKQQLDRIGYVSEKKSDLLFNLQFAKKIIACTFEIERTRKSRIRYDDFVLKYLKNTKIDLVFIGYNDKSIKKSIQESQKKWNNLNLIKPFIFCRIDDLKSNPTSFEISLNENKIAFDAYLYNLSNAYLRLQNRDNQMRLGSAEKSAKNESAA